MKSIIPKKNHSSSALSTLKTWAGKGHEVVTRLFHKQPKVQIKVCLI